jgi:hypothetical protein
MHRYEVCTLPFKNLTVIQRNPASSNGAATSENNYTSRLCILAFSFNQDTVAVASFEFLGALSYEYMYYSISYGSNHTRQKNWAKSNEESVGNFAENFAAKSLGRSILKIHYSWLGFPLSQAVFKRGWLNENNDLWMSYVF